MHYFKEGIFSMRIGAITALKARFNRQYQLANELLAVSADDIEALQLWEEFATKYCLQENLSAATPDSTIKLFCHEQVPVIPEGLRTEPIEFGQARIAGESLWLELSGALIFISGFAGNIVKIWLTPDSDLRGALELAIGHALPAAIRRNGYFELHAAGLIAPETNKGVLIIGDSGCGKSTLTMRLANSGWKYLSDDQILLQQNSSEISAWGLRRVFALTNETMQFCAPANSSRGWHLSDSRSEEKQFLDPQKIFPDRAAKDCKPEILFFPQLTHETKTRIEPMSSSHAMMQLLRQSSWLCYDPVVAPPHIQILTNLVQQCQSFHLYAGHDLLQEPNLADALLRAHAKPAAHPSGFNAELHHSYEL
jgi:hypothetical protein